MINLAKYIGAKVGVFGLGKTGIESIKALLASGAEVCAWDDDQDKILEARSIIQNANVAFVDMIKLRIIKLDFMIVSPGIPHKFPVPHRIFAYCEEHSISIKTDVELLFESCPNATYIGVTGTNGKSTTVSLIQHVLASSQRCSALGGNIGIPVLSLPNINVPSGNYVLELSSYQLESLNNARFNIASLLSVTPDHLDRYKSFDSYAAAKFKIFENQTKDDFAILSLNVDTNRSIYKALVSRCTQKVVPISSNEFLDRGVSIMDSTLRDSYFDNSVSPLTLPQSLLGQHNAENIAVTYATAKILGLSTQEILNAISSFVGLPHRMEVVLQSDKLLFINDSKATNIASASYALDAYRDIHWIAGGIFKEKNTFELSDQMKNIKHCYLVGKDADKFIELLEKNNVPYTLSKSIENALLEIKDTVSSGTILLSPACASFDQWKNFEERGDVFKELVAKLFGKQK
jgi:UDP-N-acetylmuramoylalanine--D-glutamate ligase